MQKKVKKKFFLSDIIAPELIALNCQIRREYLSSVVNVLTNSRKILHITKRGFFQLNFLHSDQ